MFDAVQARTFPIFIFSKEDPEPLDQTTSKSDGAPANASSEHDRLLIYETFMREYTSLKSEQSARIGFRDNLLYVQLAAVGAVFAFAAGKEAYADSLLVIPWLSIILGWTYVVNDHHVSRLGKYVRDDLKERMRKVFPQFPETILNWELFHRSDTISTLHGAKKLSAREYRKPIQFLIDWITFVASGAVAIAMFYLKSQRVSVLENLLVIFELILLAILSVAFWIYADMDVSRIIPVDVETDGVKQEASKPIEQ